MTESDSKIFEHLEYPPSIGFRRSVSFCPLPDVLYLPGQFPKPGDEPILPRELSENLRQTFLSEVPSEQSLREYPGNDP